MKGFWHLFVVQFQGAFSDNAFKTLVIFLILASSLQSGGTELVLLVGAVFAIPFILFSMVGGYFADRYSKRSVTIGTKGLEILVMILALAGLLNGNVAIQVLAVFLMSVQSAVFSPSKYGLLPELLPEKLLSWGNGVLSLGTFMAIITGTIFGGLLAERFTGRQHYSGLLFVVLGLAGLAFSFGITKVAAAAPERKFRANFVGDFWSQWKLIKKDRVLVLSVVGNTYFYFLAALLQINILFYGAEVLQVGETLNSLLLAAVAVGIGLGSLAAGHLSGDKIEYGLIPLGSVGMTALGIALYRPGLTYFEVATALALLGFFAGFFSVPIGALIQHRPDDGQRGGVIAASNLLSFVGIALASLIYYLFTLIPLGPRGIFLASALLTIASTLYVLKLLPDALLRLLLWILTHTVYRVHIRGRDNIPDKGGALFVSNHLSFVDALLLIASNDRFIRFIIYKGYYEHPVLKSFAKMMRTIPIASDSPPREMIRSLNEARDAILQGDVVCIFAEGQITRIGQLLPFRRGFERIMKNVDAPIIPVHLGGVWGSIFSFERGRFFWKLPRRFLSPVRISFGSRLPATSTPFEVRQAVQDLHADAAGLRQDEMHPLHRRFLSTARSHPFRFAMADGRTGPLRYGAVLAKTVFIARRFAEIWHGQEMVGVLLPPSVPAALVNLAAILSGKIPVNLNYTASSSLLRSCAEQCKLRTVVTAQEVLDRLKLEIPGQAVLLEEVAKEPRAVEKAASLLLAWLVPARWVQRALGKHGRSGVDETATVIFSSGSTGDPKGVVLSHFNVGSNIEQLERAFFLNKRDRILGVLPFFHSFGFTGTLMLPAALGVGVVYHANPLDARAVGALVSRYAVTVLLATPTFLQSYMRRCRPEQFGSVELVMAGAEKLPDRVSLAFEDHFGIRPLEAYGCTECSPAVTVNTRDYRAAGFRQVGAKRQTIGHPLPGISVRIVDPDSREPLLPGQPGLLLVKGPNVMQGYLGRPEKTAEVLSDGWYDTGDIAELDEDGFLRITDRLSRFSKIGGEMVPHIKVEEVLHDLAELTEQSFAVSGVPDSARGERLVVLHTLSTEELSACLQKLQKAELPKIWVPRSDQFFRVDTLPYLGTGKLDLKQIKRLALEYSTG